MNLELMGALNELEKERGISREVLLKAIEDAIESAFRKSAQPHQNLRVDVDEKSGRVRVFSRKAVVEKVTDPASEISLEEAQRINPRFEVDDVVEVELTLPDLGRIAAQTAKQVVVQRIREAERNRIYEEYHSRQGDILTGIIRRIEHRTVYVDLGRAEAVLPPSEQVSTERYAPGVRMKFYLLEVNKTAKGPQLVLSRSHPGLLKRLFELEVPEIHDGVVEIRAWAREPGHRSKIAVWSTDRNVDPVGACVGPRGARVQQVVKELRQEKVDVIAWDPDPELFIANALQPARVLKAYLDPVERSARVIVPEKELSLAIGKEGQNARLAARLTGWRIDIKGESQWAEVQREFEEKRREWLDRQFALPQAAQPTPAGEGATEGAVVPGAEAPASAESVEEPVAQAAGPAAQVATPVEVDAPAPAPTEPVEAEPEEVWEPTEADLEPPADAIADEEEEPERAKKAKGVGKVRRMKGAKRLERRHIEEELEESDSLPSLFEGEEEAPAAAAPTPTRSPAREETLSVPLFAVARTLETPAKAEETPAAPSPKAPEPPGREAGRGGDARPASAASEPGKSEAGQAEQPPARQEPTREQASRPAPKADEHPRSPSPGAGAEPEATGNKKPRKVLKSLADLSPEDFGFSRPTSTGPQRRGR
ncbi:transcription termination factor NusA [Geochorda subterranea]|uniref:Transcription termination/antitermination protein NusA n=1 Tax=Geochorda subterranea TaxID=3109564 RepID=A0ABZ1BL60_9FIRM|nr:transcription termination factor NusA [Limnochorda sp. LNt]WRP13305.1 transcription termination factor NusA [Limnochorda sp. LNt]